VLATALVLASCASPPAHPPLDAPARTQAAAMLIRGELSYRERIALPADSVAVVELRENAGDGQVVAEWRRTLGGQQVPVRFEMPVDPGQLQPGQRYAVRGAIFAGGQPAWVSEPQPLVPAAGDVQAGTLLLAPYRPLAFATTLRCGDRVARFGVGKRDGRDVPQLAIGDRRYDLREVVAASGARYEAIDDPRTTVWNKGDRFTLAVGGEAWPECEAQRAGGAPPAATLRARGNEPFWSVEIDRTLRLRTPDRSVEGPAPAARIVDGVRRYDGTLDGRPISVVLRQQRCSDTMTGMPHPLSAEVQFDGRTYRGCAGEPADLLVGPEWVVEDIAGGMIDRSRATLSFGADGRLGGRASCNSFTATYKIGGEGLAIGKAAATRMACAPALMQQEARFLDILEQASRFEISDSGALLLIAPDGRRITARRPK
jgi:heat shock protein HslJ/uncharacterized lipoprotein YbaY